MANNIIKRVWNQGSMTPIEDLQGSAFTNENGGHTFQISGVDSNGESLVLSGTVAASFLRPDQTTVGISGSVSGGVASVTLSEECYGIPGRFGLVIFLTSDGKKTAIYSCVGNVARSSTDAVAPGVVADVVDLINEIEAAVYTIPASYSALMADIAPTYSSSALYAVGDYAWYEGDLKRCIVPITVGETYTPAHWTSAVVGDDVCALKSAINDVFKIRTLSPTSSGATTITQELIAGKWYRIHNKSTTVNMTISFKRDGSVYQNCGTLVPGRMAFIRAKENGDQITISKDVADSTAKIEIAYGESIDAQGMDGCYDTTYYNMQSASSTAYTYPLVAGRSYRVVNNGSVVLYVRSSNSGTLSERFGDVAPGKALYFIPSVNAGQINFWHGVSSITVPIAVSEGEIIEAQTKAYLAGNEIASIETEISGIENDVISLKSETQKNIKMIDRLQTGLTKYDFPSGFVWDANPVKNNVYTNGKGHFWVDYNVMDQVSTDGVDVYVSPDGDDTNDGLTSSTPKKTLSSAISVTNARRVHVAGGYYPRQNITLSKDIDIIGDDNDRPVFTSQLESIAWSATGTNGIYTTAHKNNSKLFDLTYTDSDGVYRQYVAANSVSEVESTQGTYYDDGTTVTLHTYGNVEARLSTVCYTPGYYSARFAASGHRLLIANLCFICGGTYSSFGQVELEGNATNRGTYLVYNCDSSHSLTPTSSGGGGFHPTNADVIIQGCTAFYTGNDAFSYGNGCTVLEYYCASAHNGRAGGITSCNGSTGHGGIIVRIGCAYHDTYGPIVHDVGATDSVNLGLAAWHSTCEGKPNFCASGGTVHMWLDSCVSYSSDAGIDVGKPDEPSNNSIIYKRNCISDVADGEYGGHIYRY